MALSLDPALKSPAGGPMLSAMDKVKAERMRARARNLADSGQHPNWRKGADQLAVEGFAIHGVSKDLALVELLDLRCKAARQRHAWHANAGKSRPPAT